MKRKVILCIFGVVSRSIIHTYPRIKEMIIDNIRKEHTL